MQEIESFELTNNNTDLLRKYQLFLVTNKHLSDNSVNSYILDIYKYLSFMEDNGISDAKKIAKEDIYNYLKLLDSEKYSIYSVVRKISSIRSFHNYLSDNYNIEDVSIKIENPRFYKKLPDILSIEEVEMLLDIKLKTAFDYRNKAMLELMYGCGLRVSELINLEINDIDEINSTIRVTGKGSKDRIIPVGEYSIY